MTNPTIETESAPVEIDALVDDFTAKARQKIRLADAEKKLSDRMVLPIELSGYELAQVMCGWATVAVEEFKLNGGNGPPDPCKGFGPPWPVDTETPAEFGARIARGVLHFIKEI